MVRTQIQLTEEQSKSLKKLASKRHESLAALIRKSVDILLKSESLISEEERKQRAIDVSGKFRSGKHDLSVEHDKYLSDAFGS